MSDSNQIKNSSQTQQVNTLSEEEALVLSAHLKEQRSSGIPLDSDQKSIDKMIAGLGDPRGLLRLRFADSLGSVGQAAVPALCNAMLSSDQVTVRRAAAKTLTLIEDPNSLPDLVSAFLNDQDSVVQGSSVGGGLMLADVPAKLVRTFLSDNVPAPPSTDQNLMCSGDDAEVEYRGTLLDDEPEQFNCHCSTDCERAVSPSITVDTATLVDTDLISIQGARLAIGDDSVATSVTVAVFVFLFFMAVAIFCLSEKNREKEHLLLCMRLLCTTS